MTFLLIENFIIHTNICIYLLRLNISVLSEFVLWKLWNIFKNLYTESVSGSGDQNLGRILFFCFLSPVVEN